MHNNSIEIFEDIVRAIPYRFIIHLFKSKTLWSAHVLTCQRTFSDSLTFTYWRQRIDQRSFDEQQVPAIEIPMGLLRLVQVKLG